MGLSNVNKEYLDGYGHGPGRNNDFVKSLKEILTDADVAALKIKMKDKNIIKLNAQKEIIESKLTELSKG